MREQLVVSQQDLAYVSAAAVLGGMHSPIRQQTGGQTSTPRSGKPFIDSTAWDRTKLAKVLAGMANRHATLGCLQCISWADLKSVLKKLNQFKPTEETVV